MKIFDIDSRFMRFMAKVADVLILNFIVLVCCIPVITIGPSLVALYYVMLKEVRDEEGNIVKSFFKSFKQNFVQGVIMEIIIVALVLFFAYDIYLMYHWMKVENTAMSRIVLGALCGIAAVGAMAILYIFPMIAKFYNSTFKIIKNSIAMSISNLPYSLLMVLITAAIVFLLYINPYFIIFAVGAWAFFTSMCLVRVFDKYIPKKDEEELPEILTDTVSEENADTKEVQKEADENAQKEHQEADEPDVPEE